MVNYDFFPVDVTLLLDPEELVHHDERAQLGGLFLLLLFILAVLDILEERLVFMFF